MANNTITVENELESRTRTLFNTRHSIAERTIELQQIESNLSQLLLQRAALEAKQTALRMQRELERLQLNKAQIERDLAQNAREITSAIQHRDKSREEVQLHRLKDEYWKSVNAAQSNLRHIRLLKERLSDLKPKKSLHYRENDRSAAPEIKRIKSDLRKNETELMKHRGCAQKISAFYPYLHLNCTEDHRFADFKEKLLSRCSKQIEDVASRGRTLKQNLQTTHATIQRTSSSLANLKQSHAGLEQSLIETPGNTVQEKQSTVSHELESLNQQITVQSNQSAAKRQELQALNQQLVTYVIPEVITAAYSNKALPILHYMLERERHGNYLNWYGPLFGSSKNDKLEACRYLLRNIDANGNMHIDENSQQFRTHRAALEAHSALGQTYRMLLAEHTLDSKIQQISRP